MNPHLGEIWYELLLVGQPAPVKNINHFSAEIGKFYDEIIEIENPSSRDVQFDVDISNHHNYQIFPKEPFAKGY